MNSTTDRFLNRPRLIALVLVAGGVLGLLGACSTDGGNAAPSGPPVIITGGGGGKGGADDGEAGESSGGKAQGGSSHGGSSNGGSSNGGSDEGGGAGEGGEAGAAPGNQACPANGPTTDLGFLNQPTTSQSQVFNNTERLGAHDTLPPLN